VPRLDFYCDYRPCLSLRLESSEVLIGRAPDCAVQLLGTKVSRHHARIRACAGGHRVEDLSRNGTRVNHAWVRGSVRLQRGDRVYVGDRVFIYQPDEAPVAELQREATLAEP